jgi:chemotaxis signal transduction protein
MRGEVRNPSYAPREALAEPGRGGVDGVDVLTFSIGGEEYALGIGAIREIIKLRPITEVPRVPPFVAGIIAVRGVVMPVIDLRIRLRLRAVPLTHQARILVVTQAGGEPGQQELFGLIVDRVHHVVRLAQQDIEPPTMLSGAEAAFVAGIGRIERGGGDRAAARQTGLVPVRQRHMLILLDLPRALTFEHAGFHGPPVAGALLSKEKAT